MRWIGRAGSIVGAALLAAGLAASLVLTACPNVDDLHGTESPATDAPGPIVPDADVQAPEAGAVDASCDETPCKPTVIAKDVPGPVSIAVGPTDVYWTVRGLEGGEGRGIYGAPKGGGAAHLFVIEINIGLGLVYANDALYWTNWFAPNSLLVLPLDGGAPTALVSGLGGSSQLVRDGERLSWIVSSFGSDGEVVSVNLDGGSRADLVKTKDGGTTYNSVAAAGGRVFWTDVLGAGVARAFTDGGAFAVVASGQTKPAGIDVDGDHVYWATTGATGVIMRAAVAGGEPSRVLDGRLPIQRIKHDDRYLYFIENESSIQRVKKDGTDLVTIVRDEVNVTDLAIDGDWVYFTAHRDGKAGIVARAPK